MNPEQASKIQQTASPLGELPVELFLLIVKKLPLQAMLALAHTAKFAKGVVYNEILHQAKYQTLQEESGYPKRLLIIRNWRVLKKAYQKIHPDAQAYRALRKYTPEARLEDAFKEEKHRSIFLRYPELYAEHLFKHPNNLVMIAKTSAGQTVLTTSPTFYNSQYYQHTMQKLLASMQDNNQLSLIKYFAQKVVGSAAIAPSYCMVALAALRLQSKNFKNEMDESAASSEVVCDFQRPDIKTQFPDYEELRKAAQNACALVSLFTAILKGCSPEQADRKRLCTQLSVQAREKLKRDQSEQNAAAPSPSPR